MMTLTETTELLLDTFAWIEYFEHGSHGARIEEFLQTHQCSTPVIVIAELSDVFARKKRSGFNDALAFILAKTNLVELTVDAAAQAGELKNSQRAQQRNFGLIDAILLAIAKSRNAQIVTGDYHFNKMENVIFLD